RSLADLGVDELVVVEGPPAAAAAALDWVSALADKWMP
ncbi:MAG TPA: LLM class F420-dependent oxidoreductase, partial [Mycobacterium sp.]|nr:LLM class F420-dependent oxidoreductase [Mycobacterium sp.]